jgi:hypothetical protein
MLSYHPAVDHRTMPRRVRRFKVPAYLGARFPYLLAQADVSARRHGPDGEVQMTRASGKYRERQACKKSQYCHE